MHVNSGQPFEIEENAVIVTAPFNIVRYTHVQFVPAKDVLKTK